MEIVRLLLVGYSGFRLRQYQRFEYRPTLKTQVILGTNGSGKSRLMAELSPLPAVPTDYPKGGMKEIEIRHHGKHYLLRSSFTKDGNHFEFIVDGENLNPGRTVTVFKELVKEHFNYTQDIHDLITGRVKFSGLSVADRRKLFTLLNDADYTYALKYFQRLKEQVQDLKGALNRNKERLSQETAKALNEKEEAQLRLIVGELREILHTLLQHRKPRLNDPNGTRRSIEQQGTALESHMGRVERLLLHWEGNGLPEGEDVLQERSVALQANVQSFQREIVQHCERIGKLQESLNAVTASSSASLEDTQRTLKDLETEMGELEARSYLTVRVDDPVGAQAAFQAIQGELEAVATAIQDFPQKPYNKHIYDDMLRSYPQYEQTALKAKATADRLFVEKQHLEQHREKGHVDCPRCQHRWTPNYDDASYARKCNEHKLAVEQAEKAEKDRAELRTEIEQYQSYYSLTGRYLRAAETAALRSYWDYVESCGLWPTRASEFLNLLPKIAYDLQCQVKLVSLNRLYQEQKRLEKLMLDSKAVDKSKLEQELQELNTRVQGIQLKLRENHDQLELTKQRLNCLRDIHRYWKEAEDVRVVRDAAIRDLIVDNCVATLDEIVQSLRMTLSQHERALGQVDVQRGIVQNLTKQIAEDEVDFKLLKMAMKDLSPTEGLIARGMTGFINHFIKMTNSYIEKIWLYPMAIAPVAMMDDESVDLDYRFKVMVNGEVISNDVSRISTGMQEVIDLAFVAISMKFLRLDQFPIFLDEFARSMDPAHRSSAYTAIEHLIESSDYSQVFLVSHYQDGYSALSSSEILVLCDNNIRVPDHLAYNKHVTFN